jgi:hypothetical protein
MDSSVATNSKNLKQNSLGRRVEEAWPVLRFSFWAAMILCWFVEGLSRRHSINPDGISYLDIASACVNGRWTAAVNAYWSPVYPVLLSLWLGVFHPSALRELLAVRCFNVLTLVFAVCCFEYFLQGVLEYTQEIPGEDRGGDPLPTWVLRAT